MIEGLLVFVSVLGSGCGQARAAASVLGSKTFLVLNSQNRFLLKMIRTSINTRVVLFGWVLTMTILVQTKVILISRPTLRQ
jgi:hypothetical protein